MTATGVLDSPAPVLGREVRPTWSAREWATVAGAAAAAGMAPATWASQVVVGGLRIAGHAQVPPRCTRRGLLWGQVLERWQSVSWAVVALQDRTARADWASVSQIVGRTGVAITTQAEATQRWEPELAGEYSRTAAEAVTRIGAGVRGSARLAVKGGAASGSHRAKVLFTPEHHQALEDACRAGHWRISAYVGAVTSLAGWLASTGFGDTGDIALLEDLLTLTQATAASGLSLLTGPPQPVNTSGWTRFTGLVRESQAMVDAARSRQPTPAGDPAALVPRACVELGWAAAWGVPPR